MTVELFFFWDDLLIILEFERKLKDTFYLYVLSALELLLLWFELLIYKSF
jgi:hypothetical protein